LVSSTEAERELVISLGRWPAGPGPLYQRLAEALQAAIEREVPVGATLPPERRLAELLHVSRTTVVAAYRILRREGLLQSRRGSGTRVAVSAHTDGVERPLALGSAAAFRGLIDRQRDVVDFSAAAIGSEGILTEELQAVAARELSSLTRAPGYKPYGLPSLRRAIAQHLSESGLSTNHRQILVTNGAQQAINLLAQLLVERGSCVVVENPTYVGALDAFTAVGARLLGIPVEEQQGSPEPLRRLLRRERPRLLYLMPTFHNPTGAVSTLTRRQQLAALAAEQRTPLIEDDTLATPAIGRTPPPPIAAFDRDGHVITISSLSKSAWAGLRVGWIRAPVPLIDRLVSLKTVADLGTSLPSQTLARAVLEDFPRISALRAVQLGQCLQVASRLLREHLPEWRFRDPAGGQALWVRLPGGDGDSFAQTALKHGVTVVPGSLLSPDRSFRDHIRLQFLQPPELIDDGVQRLARAWDDYAVAAGRRDLTVVV
jgi:DNA-binding transcriptional MocR family regulator